MNPVEVKTHPDFDEHESVVFSSSETLTAIIAIHSSELGPAAGGCRMYPYASHEQALTDVLRLSRGMTYKSALAGVPFGGGKSVIMGDPRTAKTRQLLHEMGDFIESLKGQYMAAEDSGTSVADIAAMGERTRFISGVSGGRFGGDPSPLTAYGVFIGIREAVRHRTQADLPGISVAIQGVGNVGYHLTNLLICAGARVTVADISRQNLEWVSKIPGVNVVPADEILSAEVDVLAPCAMGGAINENSIYSIRAGIVAGAANNQLISKEMADELLYRGILYAPDYVINAGGIIDVYYQNCGERSEDIVNKHIERIGPTLNTIFTSSDSRRLSTQAVADEMAEKILNRVHHQAA